MNSVNINPVIDEFRTKKHVIALIIFGSVAREQSRQFSDIDLCVITRTKYRRTAVDTGLMHWPGQ